MRSNPPGADRDGSGVSEGIVGRNPGNPAASGHHNAVLQVRPPVGVRDRFVPVPLDDEPPVQELRGEVLMLGPAKQSQTLGGGPGSCGFCNRDPFGGKDGPSCLAPILPVDLRGKGGPARASLVDRQLSPPSPTAPMFGAAESAPIVVLPRSGCAVTDEENPTCCGGRVFRLLDAGDAGLDGIDLFVDGLHKLLNGEHLLYAFEDERF